VRLFVALRFHPACGKVSPSFSRRFARLPRNLDGCERKPSCDVEIYRRSAGRENSATFARRSLPYIPIERLRSIFAELFFPE